ncbi:MAG TPA: phosphotransferase [Ktedonobacterales bacterium]|nr:phosphotransferase [Ktedonobacterales bacterium]
MSETPGALDDSALIASMAPDLVVRSVRRDNGQFNDVLIVNDAWVFRFPKSPAALASLPGEVAILRALAGRLPLPIPEPRYVSLGGEHPGMGYPLLHGAPLSREWLAAAPAPLRGQVAQRLGAFLRALHALPADVLAGQPPRDGHEEWAELYANIRAHLFPAMRPDARDEVAARFGAFLSGDTGAWAPAPRHGDFGAGNILYDAAAEELTGVIDFSSAGLGDPAMDIAALSTLGDAVLDRALIAYPEAAAYLERAAFYRSTFALQQAWYGLRDGSEEDFEWGIARYR